ncbi:SAM-dependent methyltransferase [Parashewanella hymeniacidonis]|uniref:SAM-dependent methyltransferase n=1 Tax=Parashewanella hymeniacidonis TaxID=2807618 RepID=UPI001EF6D7B1|nr:cyclopropane-fatty-acyl-phospholipid synthase family protein [Parashewanella hymeniacidonis]
MENIYQIRKNTKMDWLTARCRKLMFKILEQLQDGRLDVHEATGENRCFGHCALNEDGPIESLAAKIEIRDMSCYRDFIFKGAIGAAEAYIDGKWSSPDLTQVIRVFARAQKLADNIEAQKGIVAHFKDKLFHLFNSNSIKQAKNNIISHYDLGNELYKNFLDERMQYSSAIFENNEMNLEDAQCNKLDIICKKLGLTPADHLLEIGTGWGGLAVYAAKNYGCRVTTTTISEAQYQYAKQRVEEEGLELQITLLKEDYRNLSGQFDKLVSIEMIEAVGYRYLTSFFKKCNECLLPGGKMLLQSITIADQRFDYYRNNVDFIQKHIFPGGFLPSITEIANRTQKDTNLIIHDIEDIGLHYALTLTHWRQRFLFALQRIKPLGYDERFKRLWTYYFCYCEGAFLERSISTVQIEFRKS